MLFLCVKERERLIEKKRERERERQKMTAANKDLVYLDIFVLFDKMISCSLHRWGAVQ